MNTLYQEVNQDALVVFREKIADLLASFHVDIHPLLPTLQDMMQMCHEGQEWSMEQAQKATTMLLPKVAISQRIALPKEDIHQQRDRVQQSLSTCKGVLDIVKKQRSDVHSFLEWADRYHVFGEAKDEKDRMTIDIERMKELIQAMTEKLFIIRERLTILEEQLALDE